MQHSRSASQAVGCVVVSALLLATGAMKLIDLDSVTKGPEENAVSLLGGAPLILVLGVVEVAIGAVLMTRYWVPAAWAALLLLVAFLGGIFVLRVRDIPIEACGCFGPTANVSFTIHIALLLVGIVACCLVVRKPAQA